jgi:hypothetical protein
MSQAGQPDARPSSAHDFQPAFEPPRGHPPTTLAFILRNERCEFKRLSQIDLADLTRGGLREQLFQ